jgi:hypothetical protein
MQSKETKFKTETVGHPYILHLHDPPPGAGSSITETLSPGIDNRPRSNEEG